MIHAMYSRLMITRTHSQCCLASEILMEKQHPFSAAAEFLPCSPWINWKIAGHTRGRSESWRNDWVVAFCDEPPRSCPNKLGEDLCVWQKTFIWKVRQETARDWEEFPVNALVKFLGQDLEDWKRERFSFQLQWRVFLKLAESRKWGPQSLIERW